MLSVMLLMIQKIHRLRDKEIETHKSYKYETGVQIMKEEKENNVQKQRDQNQNPRSHQRHMGGENKKRERKR